MRLFLFAAGLIGLTACSEPGGSPTPDRSDWDQPDQTPDDPNAGDPVDTANPWPEDTENWDDDEPVDEGCEGPVGLNKGDCAPDFTMTSSRNTEVSLSQFQGKRVIVVGTATW